MFLVIRVFGSVIVLLLLYYLLPMSNEDDRSPVVLLTVALVVLAAVVTVQVRSIVVSSMPGLRAIEALATSIPLLILSFSTAYFLMSESSDATFTEPLSKTDALYFTVTVFATVGFGDISAASQAARLVVTGQMALDLVVIGLGLRIILGAVQLGQARQAGATPAGGGPVTSPEAPSTQGDA